MLTGAERPGLFLFGDGMAKAFARKFYSSKAWQDCRNEYMKRAHHLCENCLRKGIYKPAEIVHHIIEIDPITIEHPEIALNFDNLEAVCRDCHDEYHNNRGQWSAVNERRRQQRADSNRYIVGPNGEISAK